MNTAKMERLFILFVFMTCNTLPISGYENHEFGASYRAAILEHELQPRGPSSLATMLANVRVYSEKATEAAKQGAQIIVFPEYGITGMDIDNKQRDFCRDFHQDVPDPQKVQWIPCLEPHKYEGNITILQELSCIARNNSIALVTNLVSRVPCDSKTTSACPEDEQFFFNTNVIFGSDGKIMAAYHKRHLFLEPGFDPAPKAEIVIVDLGFVQLATFVCFDIMFADPAVQLVKKYGVTNIAFPTAWMNELPFITSVQAFSGFAYGMGINLLAANLYRPKGSSLGSGIYSFHLGALNETYDLATPGRLIIADVPTNPLSPINFLRKSSAETPPKMSSKVNSESSSPLELRDDSIEQNQYVFTDKPSSAPVGKIHMVLYQDLKMAKVAFLSATKQTQIICTGKICCEVDYELTTLSKQQDSSYALLAFDDLHGQTFDRFYLQICAVVRCESGNASTCGQLPETQTDIYFNRLKLRGHFTTDYLFPSVISTELDQIPPTFWKFSRSSCLKKHPKTCSGSLDLNSNKRQALLSARILGRVYERDGEPTNQSNSQVTWKTTIMKLINIFKISILRF